MTSKTRLYFLLVLPVLLAACRPTTAGKSPEEVLLAFYDEIKELDFEDAKAYTTEDSYPFLDLLADLADQQDGMEQDIETEDLSLDDIRCTVNGEVAVCTILEDEVQMMREADGWKVRFDPM